MLENTTLGSRSIVRKRHSPNRATNQAIRIFSLLRSTTSLGGEGTTRTRIHGRSTVMDGDTPSAIDGVLTLTSIPLFSVDNCLRSSQSNDWFVGNWVQSLTEGWSS